MTLPFARDCLGGCFEQALGGIPLSFTRINLLNLHEQALGGVPLSLRQVYGDKPSKFARRPPCLILTDLMVCSKRGLAH